MKWIAKITQPKILHFVIEKDQLHNLADNSFVDGYYLYVYDGEKNIYDDLQDSLEFAQEQALEEFGVPMNAWLQAE